MLSEGETYRDNKIRRERKSYKGTEQQKREK
jgi:hypothetical protein